MKYTIILLLFLTACASNESASIDKDAIFNNSVKYLNSKLNNKPEEGVIEFIALDTITPLTAKKMEGIRMKPLIDEINFNMKAWEDFQEIDQQFGSSEGTQTKFYREKTIELGDSLERWSARKSKLDSINHVGYQAIIIAEGTDTKSGAKMKDLQLGVYLDKDYDVDLMLNNLIYGNK